MALFLDESTIRAVVEFTTSKVICWFLLKTMPVWSPYRLAKIIIAKCVFYGCYKVVRVQVYHERPIRQVLGHFNSKSISWCFACHIGHRIWQIINTEIYFVNKPHVLGPYRNFELSIGCIFARTAPRYYPSHRQLGIGRIADTAGHTFFVVQHFLGLTRIGTVWWERLLFSGVVAGVVAKK